MTNKQICEIKSSQNFTSTTFKQFYFVAKMEQSDEIRHTKKRNLKKKRGIRDLRDRKSKK